MQTYKDILPHGTLVIKKDNNEILIFRVSELSKCKIHLADEIVDLHSVKIFNQQLNNI